MILAILMLAATNSFAAGQDGISGGDQIQDQQLIHMMDYDQDQSRIEIRERLHITEESKIQLQERLQTQDQTQLCFPDIEHHWAREQIRSAYYGGMASGYLDGNFNPNRNISGSEAVIMVSRMIKCIEGIDAEEISELDINWDNTPMWAREQMKEPAALRIANQNQFYGDQQLNRIQFMVMLAKSLGLEPVTAPEETNVFNDIMEISESDLGYFLAVQKLGIINGDSGSFYPNRLVTRAEVVVMLTRVLNVLEEIPEE
jgi:hypothetical protein